MELGAMMTNGVAFAVVGLGYLLLAMVTTSPRIWGYHDYPEVVRQKVPAQTRRERAAAAVIGLPWLAFVLGFPVYSTYAMKSSFGGEIPFLTAFLNPFVMLQLMNLGDVLILDWLIVNRITPRFVIIPGSSAADYKDMSHHYRAHVWASGALVPVCLVIAAVVSYT
jgi:hypothetical protein